MDVIRREINRALLFEVHIFGTVFLVLVPGSAALSDSAVAVQECTVSANANACRHGTPDSEQSTPEERKTSKKCAHLFGLRWVNAGRLLRHGID